MSKLNLITVSLWCLALMQNAASAATVFTANESENSVSVIDTVSGQSTKVQLSFAPHNVDFTVDRRILLVTGMSTMDSKAGVAHGAGHDMGRLLLMDVGGETPSVIGEYSVGAHPAHVVAGPDGRTVYISDSETNQILIFDLIEKKIVKRITVGLYPHGIRLSPDGKTLAVANLKDNSVSFIDVEAGTERGRFNIGVGPVQVAFTPKSDKLLVALNGELPRVF